MNQLRKIYRYLWVSAWYAFVVVVVLMAITFGLARLLLPFADQYNAEMSARLSGYLGQPVLIRALDAEWHGWGPSLVLKDVSLLDGLGEHPALQFDKARLGLNLIASLHQWRPVFSHISLVGVKLVLRRSAGGDISVEGFDAQDDVSDGAPGQELARFANWLFSQGRLELEDSDITWIDEMGPGRELRFSAVNISLRNAGERHQLEASVDLPRSLGHSLRMLVDIQGNPLEPRGQRVEAYFEGEKVRLAELFAAQPVAGVSVSVAAADYHLWASWEEGVFRQLLGDVAASDLRLQVAPGVTGEALPAAERSMELASMGGQFRWRREPQGWRFNADNVHMTRQGRHWPPTRVAVNYTEGGQSPPEVDVAVSYLQLQDVSRLLTLFSVGDRQVRDTLAAIAPSGHIRDTEIHWKGGEQPRYRAYTRLENAAVRSWESVPAANTVYGQLWLNETGGQVVLDSASIDLDFPWLFRWPLRVDQISGRLGWERRDGQWRLSGRELAANNADVRARAVLDVVRERADSSPFMSMQVDFWDGDGSQASRYLPTGIMSPAAVEWLDAADIAARVTHGGIIMHGRLQDFPFTDGSGVFETRFSVENGSLTYAKGWPPLQDVKADLLFRGAGMSADIRSGRIFTNQITGARVAIPDMTQTPLRLSVVGKLRGPTQDKLDYLVQSPALYDAFARHIEDLSATGESELFLDLKLPIGNDEPTKVDGWVSVAENSLSIPPMGRIASEIEGRLAFTESSLSADDIRAELLGQTSSLTIDTDATGRNRSIHVRASGIFDAPDLAAHFLPSFRELLEGDAEWDIHFDIPVGEQDDAGRVATLHASTDMVGVATRLPPPFVKKPAQRAELDLSLSFPPERDPVLRVAYDGFFDSVFELGASTPSGIGRGEIQFNGNTATLPEQPGVRVLGWLDTLPWDDWQSLWLSIDRDETADSGPPFLHSADVAVRVAQVYGQELLNLQLKINPEKGAWRVRLKSEEIEGKLTVPFRLDSAPVDARLKRAYLSESRGGGGVIDPREIAAFNLRVDDFRYKQREFGSLLAQTTRVADGLRLEQLVVRPRATTITARGGWYVTGDRQHSSFQMQMQSRDVGRTLKAMGYAGGISGGEGVLNLDVNWPGPFVDPDVAGLSGRMDLTLTDGQLLDIEPGAGRVFGMLSLQTLPRRLLLDFSDVFRKGFSFDRIQGSFTIDEGDAYTNDLYMEGPAARVEVGGRVGLADRDYDQQATVTPHLTDSLPVIGALTAAPQVGAIILFAQKLFQPQIDDATRTRYSITGSWDRPVIKKIDTPRPAPEPDEEP